MSAQITTEQPEISSILPVCDVAEYIQKNIERYLQELSFICAIDSGTHYKPGVDAVACYFEQRMRELGMEVTVFRQEPWGDDVYGVLHGDGHGKVALLGHMDTVYPVGIGGQRPVRIEGNTVLGPGVYDMKGCILSALYAIEALLALGYRSFGEVRLLCVSDEEISIRHSTELMKMASEGCEGVLVLEGARDDGSLVRSRKGGAWYKLSARGHSAHAGVEPDKGRNAVVELAHQIMQFQSLNGWRKGLTINIGRISGGTAANVVPDYAEVTLDLRFLHREDCQATEARWKEMMLNRCVPGVELTLEIDADHRDPMECTPGNRLMIQYAQEIACLLGFELDAIPTGGISDANFVSGLGFPVLDGLGPIGGLDHSPNEYIELDSIAPRAALLAGLISVLSA
jgi:glutamate carboxypeptidase